MLQLFRIKRKKSKVLVLRMQKKTYLKVQAAATQTVIKVGAQK